MILVKALRPGLGKRGFESKPAWVTPDSTALTAGAG